MEPDVPPKIIGLKILTNYLIIFSFLPNIKISKK